MDKYDVMNTSEIIEHEGSFPSDARFDEVHEKFMDTDWVRLDAEVKYLNQLLSSLDNLKFKIEKHISDLHRKK